MQLLIERKRFSRMDVSLAYLKISTLKCSLWHFILAAYVSNEAASLVQRLIECLSLRMLVALDANGMTHV